MSTESVLTIISSLFFVLGGVAVFMVGMDMMGGSLEKAAGKGMRSLMSKATRNPALGIGTGAAVTAIVNSSSATTVMIVGFVNVGFMSLTQATYLIMGANIGTTVSAFIMALSSTGSALSISAIFALVAFVGLMMKMLSRADNVRRIGDILCGLGLIFVGLNVMSVSVSSLTDTDTEVGVAIANLFQALGGGESGRLTWQIPVLFLVGAALTALMQSSAAITGICIALASSGLITTPMAMCIILGTNIGTCCTSMLSSIGASTNAKRAAMIHLLFNVLGALIFIWPVAFAGTYIAGWLDSITTTVEWQIAIFHLLFNVITTLILVWFTKYIVKLACLIIPDKKKKKGEEKSQAEEGNGLDARLLMTPAIAVGQTRKELVRMGRLAFSNYKLAVEMITTYDLSKKDEFDETENQINEMRSYISSFLIKLSSQEISEQDETKVGTFYNVANEFERIGDYAGNISEFAQHMVEHDERFSEHALAEIIETDGYLTELYENTEAMFSNRDVGYMGKVDEAESQVNRMRDLMRESHLRRMEEGRCTADVGATYLQLIANLERIGDHMHNIAVSVTSYAK